ncbi:hypothetical protein A5881_003017 [Enterococcus termitis]|nr:hypothetical protein A5881_002329 [Enterococcus termitis]
MKKSKMNLITGVFVLGVIISFGVFSQGTLANEKKIYVSDDWLRKSMVDQIEEPVENELPTAQQMSEIKEISGTDNGSIEGVQYAINAEKIQISGLGITDFRPISGMNNLKEYHAYSSLIQGDEEQVLNITPFGELQNLENLYFGYANIRDFSMLSELPKLKSIQAFGGMNVNLPTVYVDKSTKKFVMEHPVKYSKQFDGERTVSGSTDKQGVTVEPVIENNAVIINNLDESISKVYLSFEASSKDNDISNGFFASFSCEIPIVWY